MTPRQRRSIGSILVLACSLVPVACDSGQIGGEVRGPGGETDLMNDGTASVGCEDARTIPLTPDAPTNLGIDGQALIARIEGEHSAELDWLEDPSSRSAAAQITPSAGDTSITVKIEPDASTLRLVERQVAGSGDGEEVMDDFGTEGMCSDVLRIDARVTVVMENGAFNDTFTATFTAYSANHIDSSIPVTPGELSGSFDVIANDSSSEPTQTALTLTVTPGGFSGDLSGIIETTTSEAVGATLVTYARFPNHSCDMGFWVDPESEFASVAVATLDELTAFDLTWRSGSTTELDLVHDVSSLCFQGTSESIIMQVLSAATSSDGRIDGSWALEAHVLLTTDGSPLEVMLLRQAYMVDTFSAADFEEATGISGITLASGTQGSFQFDATRALDETATAGGSMTIVQLTTPDCTEQETIEEIEGGGATPGCQGASEVELESAVITSRVTD